MFRIIFCVFMCFGSQLSWGASEWRLPLLGGTVQVSTLENGKIIAVMGDRLDLISAEGKVLWEAPISQGLYGQSARLLKDGNIGVIASTFWTGKDDLFRLEFDLNGRAVSKTKLANIPSTQPFDAQFDVDSMTLTETGGLAVLGGTYHPKTEKAFRKYLSYSKNGHLTTVIDDGVEETGRSESSLFVRKNANLLIQTQLGQTFYFKDHIDLMELGPKGDVKWTNQVSSPNGQVVWASGFSVGPNTIAVTFITLDDKSVWTSVTDQRGKLLWQKQDLLPAPADLTFHSTIAAANGDTYSLGMVSTRDATWLTHFDVHGNQVGKCLFKERDSWYSTAAAHPDGTAVFAGNDCKPWGSTQNDCHSVLIKTSGNCP